MQSTTNQANITVSVTTAKPQANSAIRKVTVYDRRGQAQVKEKVRGITI